MGPVLWVVHMVGYSDWLKTCFCHHLCHLFIALINDAVRSIPQNVKLFTILQDVFNFFGSSLNRWELQIESEKDPLTLKKVFMTWWSSRINGVRAVWDRYTHILKVLTRISLTSDKTSERNTASTLRKDLNLFEFVMFIVLWERILRAFNSSSKELQSLKMNLSAAYVLLNFTKNELQHIRENWDSVVETATASSRSWNVKVSFSSPYGVRTQNANEYDTAFEDQSHSFKVNVFTERLT